MIYFKDPRVKIHKEKWGVIVRVEGGTVTLDKRLTSYLKSFSELKVKRKSELPPEALELLEKKILLEISDEEAGMTN